MSTLKVNTINAATSGQAVEVDVKNPKSFRNMLVNGSMNIAQRGATGHTGDGYSLDMFARQQSSDGAFTVTQSTTSPDGFSKSLKVEVTTADTSLAASQYAQIKTKIEAQDLQHLAYGTSAAKDITVSFYVRSNKTGNYGFSVNQSDNSFKQVSFQYAISSSNTWERKSFTIPGDTSGVINDDTGDGFIISWGLAAGTDRTSGSLRSTYTAHASADQYAGQVVNLLDSTNNEWYLTGVQVEVGEYATDFEHRSYAEDLARCERYYKIFPSNLFDGYTPIANGYCSSNTRMQACLTFTPMRAIPAVTFTGNFRVLHGNGNHSVDSHDTSNNGNNTVMLRMNRTDGALDQGKGGMVTQNNDLTAKVMLSAEL